MTREEIIVTMDTAAKEDRERFFAIADSMQFQPRWQDKLQEIETVRQQWRDMTNIENYPEIKFPLALPDWFPAVKFASCWDVGYVEKTLEDTTCRQLT